MIDLSKFRAVIFDFDGVLVDSETLQLDAWRQAARELGLNEDQIDITRTAGRMDRHIVGELFPEPHAQACLNRKWEIQDEMENAGLLQPIPGAIDLLHRLATTHKLAIASSTWPIKIQRWIERSHLDGIFTAIVACGDQITCKPAPDCYLRALQMIGVTSADACAVEDSATGIAAAKAAGVFTIQLLHLYMPRVDADAHIDSLLKIQ